MQIVDRIKLKCKEKGTTMGTLEKELGFANGTIRNWDIKTPGLDRAYKLANRLEVSLEWIITGKDAAELTPEEIRLIECYRAADPAGKDAITGQAEYQAAKALPPGLSASAPGRTGTDN